MSREVVRETEHRHLHQLDLMVEPGLYSIICFSFEAYQVLVPGMVPYRTGYPGTGTGTWYW